jgi:hypothetical protein
MAQRLKELQTSEPKKGLVRTSSMNEGSFKGSFRSFQLLTQKKDEIEQQQDDMDAPRNAFTLRFNDKKMESEFQQYYVKENLRKAQYAILLVFIVELVSSGFDFIFFNRNGISLTNINAWVLVLLRYIVVLMFGVLGLASLTSRVRSILQYGIWLVSFLCVCIFIVQHILMFKALDSLNYGLYFVAHSCLLLLYMFTFSTLQNPFATVAALVFCFLTIVPIAFGTPGR